jgi:predicted nucleotidyltransferase
VQDVLVLIHDTPEADKDDDNEIRPTSGTIFINCKIGQQTIAFDDPAQVAMDILGDNASIA